MMGKILAGRYSMMDVTSSGVSIAGCFYAERTLWYYNAGHGFISRKDCRTTGTRTQPLAIPVTPGFSGWRSSGIGAMSSITSDDQRTEKRAVAGHKINPGEKAAAYPNAAVSHQFNETTSTPARKISAIPQVLS